MNAAETDFVPVVYISIGSECKWKQWSIDVLYQGLKELGCKVIWSLKNPDDMFKMPEENPNFWIRAWIPQIEVLAHPAMKAGLTHCGMGGTLEFISMGVPAVLFPHCGDQHTNAANLRNAGAAVTLHDKVRLSKDFGDVISYKQPCFDAAHVKKTFETILKDPKYKENMMKLKAQSLATGGRDLYVKTVERHYIAGVDHLVDEDLIKKASSKSCCLSCWSFLIFFGILGFLIYGTVMYFTDD